MLFAEVVQPLLRETFPALRYAAALLGSGSEVLGFDTEMSTDHDWGPRVDLFLAAEEPFEIRGRIDAMLRERLPRRFRGYATSVTDPDPVDNGTRLPDDATRGPVRHKIEILTPADFFGAYLGFDIASPIAPADWLTFPSQKLRSIASGPLFHDDIGLAAVRARFAYYPDDVWRYLLASGWARVGQEEHLMGRAGSVGDELGSSIIGARLVRDLMALCFLMERVFAPYPKWFGSAFQQLRCAPTMSPHLRGALAAATWRERERFLVSAYELVAALHTSLAITRPLPASAQPFFNRPFQVIALGGFAAAIADTITDESLRRLISRPLIGGIDQFSDSTDLLQDPQWRPAIRTLYVP